MNISEKKPLSLMFLLRSIMTVGLFLSIFALAGCEQAEQAIEGTMPTVSDVLGGNESPDDDDDNDDNDDDDDDEKGDEKSSEDSEESKE